MTKRQIYTIISVCFTTLFLSSFITELLAVPIEKSIEELGLKTKETISQEEVITRPTVEYTADGLRDPFQEPFAEKAGAEQAVTTGEEKPLPSLTIQGLVWGGRFPQAIINNKVLKVGDIIEGAQVINISKDGVSLLFDGKLYELQSPVAETVPSKKR